MTQTQEVLTWLRTHASGITPGQALDAIGTMRLAARVSDAREFLAPDEEIVNVGFTTPSGKHVARYVLRKREPKQMTWKEWA
jgi:hypothetical protein